MITALSISNFVLIDRLDVSTRSGFTALTGETGAGKSIILDALGIALGMRPEKRFVRVGAKMASVALEFDLPPDHPVWPYLDDLGFEAFPDEPLILRRTIPANGKACGFINDQKASTSVLLETGQYLVEIQGQHAASNLLKPAYHRDVLDNFAGTDKLLSAYAKAWDEFQLACAAHADLAAQQRMASEAREALTQAVEELTGLDPQAGETETLGAERTRRMQAGRIAGAVAEATRSLERSELDMVLAGIAAGMTKLTNLPGFHNTAEGELPVAVNRAAEAFERANIEVIEAGAALQSLAWLAESDDEALEATEARLFALKAAARKYAVDPDALADKRAELASELALVEAGEAGLAAARQRETDMAARWRGAADRLHRARKTAAKRLEKQVSKELTPLKLGNAKFRISVDPLDDEQADRKGADKICILVETNPGAGFASLQKVASGGELARLSLALNCACASAGSTVPTLIFDEADQGVGGAVAAAIGERFIRLGGDRQVFAVTHSPQVAAAADSQWRIEKGATRKNAKAVGLTRACVLDAHARLEEIARMLSGAEVTPEARAAAERLLEG
ncbi:MAG: DNA repair protein RecN [Hyphomonadaceae bacterium]